MLPSLSIVKYICEHCIANGKYALEVSSTSSKTNKLLDCFNVTSAASFFKTSKVKITLSSSKMFPCTLLMASNKESSSSLNLAWYSPCNFNNSHLLISISGLSLFNILDKH